MVRYIELDALVAEIDKGINGRNDWQLDEYRKGYHDALTMLKKYLSTLEVKEVDLNEEVKKYLFNCIDYDGLKPINIAKHFYELGMQVSNKSQK